MLINLLCWLWIAVSAFIFGTASLGILKRINGYDSKEPDQVMIFGICLLTVYAQFFSLFYKVGLAANVGLIILNILLGSIFYKDMIKMFSEWKEENVKLVALMLLLLAIVYLKYASDSIEHYDTYLYHAQSIRWIEEYGVVPGVGNLHNRIAYNSSIFSLQALFSFRFFWGGYSLHSINGFLGLIFMLYALCSLKVLHTWKFHVSDLFRVGLLFYIVSQRDYISSPGSDLFALCMISYILIKWIALLEEKVTDALPYIPLCLMSVFTVSVKLTAAMLVLLAILPAVRLVRAKRWKEIAAYMALGTIMILPFLIRNVVISGWLLYPVTQLDFFSFDWKMPEFTLCYDKNEIKAWGMGLNDVTRYNAPFGEWFPVWREGLSRMEMWEVFSLPITVAVSLGISLYRTAKTKQADWLCVVLTMLAIILLWFDSAPLLRYGSIFLLFFPCFIGGTVLESLNSKIRTIQFPLIIVLILVVYNSYPTIRTLIRSDWDNKIVGKDYEEMQCRAVSMKSELFYIPVEGDQAGYYAFPSTPYEARLNVIEMRGDSLKDGFRIKKEYEDCFISNYAQVFEENIFK